MMRGKTDNSKRRHLILSLITIVLVIGFLCYWKSSFSSGDYTARSALDYGTRTLRSFRWNVDENDELGEKQDDSSLYSLQEDNTLVPKSFPVGYYFSLSIFGFIFTSTKYSTFCVYPKVCDDQHSELIPCLDRHLRYQMRLKLDQSLMEHYERHCPLPERRYNCLIPPPPGYKV